MKTQYLKKGIALLSLLFILSIPAAQATEQTITATMTTQAKTINLSGAVTLAGNVISTATPTLTAAAITGTFDNPVGDGAATTVTVSVNHLTKIATAQKFSGAGTITAVGNSRYSGTFATSTLPYCEYIVTTSADGTTYTVTIDAALTTANAACTESNLQSDAALTADGATKNAVGAKGVAFTAAAAPQSTVYHIAVHEILFTSVRVLPGAIAATAGSSTFGVTDVSTLQTFGGTITTPSSDATTLFSFVANTGAGNYTKTLTFSAIQPKNVMAGDYAGVTTVTYV